VRRPWNPTLAHRTREDGAPGTSRVLICFYQGRLVALHGFIKKTRAMPLDDLALARKRQKELEQ
jgi:phage-related protein